MNFKKFAVGCMCALLAIGTVGCGSKEEPTTTTKTEEKATTETATTETKKEESAPAKKDSLKITYWTGMNGNVSPVAQNYGEVEFYKAFQEKTGIEIEFLHPPVGQDNEQFKLLIASRKDLPDMIQNNWNSAYPGGPEKALKDGIIISLNDYMKDAPNYQAALDANPAALRESKTDSGTIYALQGINKNDLKTFSGLMIRKDILDELGLGVPETIEDWEVMLRAFKDKGIESPLCIRSNELLGVNLINAAYTSNSFFLDDNGVVQYGPIQPEYKEYIATLNRWYKEGLLDPDFASLDDKIIDSNLLNDNAGVVFGWIGGSMGKWYNATQDEKFELVGVSNPVINKGDQGKFLSGFVGATAGTSAVITTAAKDPAAIMQAFDFLYTEEGLMMKNFGTEGLTYEMVDGKPMYTDLIMNNPEGLPLGQAMGKYFQANYGAPGFCEIPEYQEQYYKLDAQKEARLAVNKYVDSAAPHVVPPVTPTPEESKDMANIMTEIGTYKDEKLIAFITGVEPIENFDAYVEQIKQLGIDRAIEIQTAGIERFNAR